MVEMMSETAGYAKNCPYCLPNWRYPTLFEQLYMPPHVYSIHLEFEENWS